MSVPDTRAAPSPASTFWVPLGPPPPLGLPKITSGPISSGPPASPADGDIWIALAAGGAGENWQFRYNAGSASAYKWEYIGGPPVVSYVATEESTTSGGFVEPTTPQRLTATRAGDYLLEYTIGVRGASSVMAVLSLVDIAVPTSFAVTHPMAWASGAGIYTFATTRQRVSGIAAGRTFALQFASASGSISIAERSISITPIRVS